MITRKEAFKMAMDIDGHMNDSSQGIDLSWDSIEKLVNEAYAKGAAAEREACAEEIEKIFQQEASMDTMREYVKRIIPYEKAAAAIRARGQG